MADDKPTVMRGLSSSILLQEYIRDIAPTDMLPPDLGPVMMGLFGEVGSLMTTAKKHIRDKDAFVGYQKAVYEEFGDTLWYFSALCRRLKIGVDELLSKAANGHGYGQIIAASDLPEGPIAHIAAPRATPPLSEALLQLGVAASALLILRSDTKSAHALMIEFASSYLQAVQASGVTFSRVVHGNLAKARDRFLKPNYADLPRFDDRFDEEERLPERFEVKITQRRSGQSFLQFNGVFVGDPLTDNILDPDGYRFHDAFHFAHAAILHWSPVVRALIKQKRKSDKRVDEAQDGGRAIVIEEGLTAWIFAQAKELNLFDGRNSISFDLLKTVREFVAGYEVEECPLNLWETAILSGFEVFRQLRSNEGGIIVGDRTARTLKYRTL